MATTATATTGYFGDWVKPCGSSLPSRPISHEGNEENAPFRLGCLGVNGLARNTRIVDRSKDTTEDAADLIAKEMGQLSLGEREQAYEDLHGVSAAIPETPQLIAESLFKMEHHLHQIQNKRAYDIAHEIHSDYVHDEKLLLMFLRADKFGAEKAAKRLVEWLDWKLSLFGQTKLCQPHIGLNDLDDDGKFMVESGFIQILPGRDSRGRTVLVVAANYHRRLHRTRTGLLQMMFYIFMCALEDETNQVNGVVLIGYSLGKEEDVWKRSEKHLRDAIWDSCHMVTCLPVRVDALHFCHVPHALRYALAHVAKGVGKYLRARLRAHFGSHLECAYALETFGLPSSLLPFTTEGELKTVNHKKWTQRRIIKEEEVRMLLYDGSCFSGIDLPRRYDILLGQGKPFQNHPGNQRLRELLQDFQYEYNGAEKNGGRTAVAHKIVNMIQNSTPINGEGVRFLKRREDRLKSGWWEEETDLEIMVDKVCNGLRNERKRKAAR